MWRDSTATSRSPLIGRWNERKRGVRRTPVLPREQQRTRNFSVRLTVAESRAWGAAATDAGLALGPWMVRQCQAAVPAPPPAVEEPERDAAAAARMQAARNARRGI